MSRHLERADRYFEQGNFEAALIEYKNVLAFDSRNDRAIARSGAIWLEQGAPLRAVPFLLLSRSTSPEDVASRMRLALALRAIGQPSEARTEANEILLRDPTNEQAILLLAETARTEADVEHISRHLEKLAESDPKPVGYHLGAGFLAIRRADLAGAESHMQSAVAAAPDSFRAHMALANIREAQNKTAEAETEWKLAADLSPIRSHAKLRLADFYTRQDRMEDARSLLEDVIRKAPGFLPAPLLLAQLALDENALEEVHRRCDAVLSQDALNFDARLLKGRAYLAAGDPGMAVKILTSLDADYPRMPITKFRLGQALLKEGSTARGMALLDLAIQIAPDFEEALLLRAELHLKAGDAMSAWMSMRKLLESRPRSTIAKMMLARAYSGAGLFDQASDLYRERIAASPDDYRPHLLLGLIERERGNMTDAREAFRTAHDLNPNDPTATIRLVELDLSESKLDAARLWVEQLLARDPESATVHYLEALISRAEGLDGKAEKALKTCLGLDLNYSLAYNLLIEILLADGRLEEAHRELQEVIARDPGDISSLLLAASLEQGLEDFPSARQRYETILKIDPNVPVAQNNLAFLYLDKFERPEEAYELIIRARSTLPEDPLIADTFGWVLFHRGDYRKAQVVLEECAVALPSHHEIQYHVGRARLMNGDFKRALAALEVAIAAKFPFSGSDEAARLRGLLLTLTSDPPPGIDELQKLADANPSDIAPDLMLASSHEESGRFAESAEACLQALTINPDLFPAHTMLARLYAGPLAALEKALHHAKNAHALAPQDPMVAATLGRIAYKTGNHDLAINLLRESIQDQPDRSEVLYPLAYATYRIGQIEQAFSIMQRALETELEEPRRLEMSAFLRMLELHQPARADLESANREIDEVLKRDPDDLPARMARAAIAAADGEHESAAAVYRNELALYPAFPLAQRELAGILARPGKGQDLEAAVRLIREARKRLPADVRTATIRAEISYRQGNHDYAIRSLEGLDRQGSLTPEGIAVLGLARIAGGRVGDGKSDLKRAVDAGLRGPLLQDVHKARRP